MESEEESQDRAKRRAVRNAIIAKVEADNAEARATRNARRYKAERDPIEYEAQKDRQRRQYEAEQGGPVRSYKKIIAVTKEEHGEVAKARDAERKAGKRAAMSPEERQADTDKKADHQWVERRRARGIPEDVIQAGLIAHIQEREAKRAVKAQADAEEAMMRGGSNFGRF
ncbi:hypothetical protein [Rhodobacter sp. SY28-1]|uniref:hypothetical protein n=1 Tax=Rhodobacter sp. SY28-1 TaxID=2562317 RepID=UPI0010BFD394|nr:hypothetical protein [Rhodobacter sp. SY28-1]